MIDAGSTDRSAISIDMFDGLQKVVFNEIFYNTFQRFIETPAYAQMHEDIKNAYNKVRTQHEVSNARWDHHRGRRGGYSVFD